MITGRQTLDSISRALADERRKSQEVDARAAAASDRLLAIDAERGRKLAELARVRLGHIAAGTAGRLAGADGTVAAMLAARERTREELRGSVEALDASVERLEAERTALADALEETSEAIDEAEAEIQERLAADAAYRERRQRAEAAARTARHADEKAREREAERAVKGRAFEAEPIFTYLWRRGYGTPRYRAWPLTRALDRWAARLIGFEAARANYARLVELPVRVREHADAVDALAQEEFLELKRLDDEARVAGGVPELEARREAARDALDRHDEALAEAARVRQEAFERLERIDRGEDEQYAEAIAYLTSALGREDVQELRRAALATPMPDDDVLAAALLELEAEHDRVRTTLDELRSVSERHRNRLRELEALRREFTRSGMHGPGTTYPDRDLITTMITQFLLGAATRDALWRVLEGQRRTQPGRADPTFGSGGFGKGSPWSGGRGASGGGRGPFAGGGSFGGGGRSTGGGFGGGGFRTGGRIGGGGRGFRTGGKF